MPSNIHDHTVNVFSLLLNLNVKYLDRISFETTYAKLALAYKSFKNEKKRNIFLKKNNFFEKISF